MTAVRPAAAARRTANIIEARDLAKAFAVIIRDGTVSTLTGATS